MAVGSPDAVKQLLVVRPFQFNSRNVINSLKDYADYIQTTYTNAVTTALSYPETASREAVKASNALLVAEIDKALINSGKDIEAIVNALNKVTQPNTFDSIQSALVSSTITAVAPVLAGITSKIQASSISGRKAVEYSFLTRSLTDYIAQIDRIKGFRALYQPKSDFNNLLGTSANAAYYSLLAGLAFLIVSK